jgi:hypothetical protein
VSVGETIFNQGDTTDSGLVMVVDGALGVYGAFEKDLTMYDDVTLCMMM